MEFSTGLFPITSGFNKVNSVSGDRLINLEIHPRKSDRRLPPEVNEMEFLMRIA